MLIKGSSICFYMLLSQDKLLATVIRPFSAAFPGQGSSGSKLRKGFMLVLVFWWKCRFVCHILVECWLFLQFFIAFVVAAFSLIWMYITFCPNFLIKAFQLVILLQNYSFTIYCLVNSMDKRLPTNIFPHSFWWWSEHQIHIMQPLLSI